MPDDTVRWGGHNGGLSKIKVVGPLWHGIIILEVEVLECYKKRWKGIIVLPPHSTPIDGKQRRFATNLEFCRIFTTFMLQNSKLPLRRCVLELKPNLKFHGKKNKRRFFSPYYFYRYIVSFSGKSTHHTTTVLHTELPAISPPSPPFGPQRRKVEGFFSSTKSVRCCCTLHSLSSQLRRGS